MFHEGGMTTRTRYFVIVSLLTLTVGLGAGLVAYYTGFTTSAFTREGGPDELQFVPANATLVAYAEVRDIMTSELRQKIRSAFIPKEDGQREFETKTGINIETDIDRVVVSVVAGPEQTRGSALVLARGRFDQVKIESLMRDDGAQVEEYKGVRLVVANPERTDHVVSLAFLEPGLIAVGSTMLVKGAVDLKGGGASIATNDEMMHLIAQLDSGNAWAAGRFADLTARANLPSDVAQQLPAIKLFSISAQIDSGVRGLIRAEARDEESANNLRDVMRGFLALAKMRSSARPEFQAALDALQLGGTGTTVVLSFELPGAAIDALAALHSAAQPSIQ